MVSFQIFELAKIPELSKLKIAEDIQINGSQYTIDDIHEVACVGSQGELPVKSLKGRKSTSVDLAGPNDSFGNIDYSTEGDRLFFGKYIDFDDLKFMNLREIDGW